MIRGSNALVIWPSVLPLPNAVPGLLNRVWFNTLNASTRKSTFLFSVIRNVLQSAASTSQFEGPRIVFLPALPKVPAACLVKAEELNHCLIVGLLTFQSATTLGRSLPSPVRDTSVPSVIVSQAPLV